MVPDRLPDTPEAAIVNLPKHVAPLSAEPENSMILPL